MSDKLLIDGVELDCTITNVEPPRADDVMADIRRAAKELGLKTADEIWRDFERAKATIQELPFPEMLQALLGIGVRLELREMPGQDPEEISIVAPDRPLIRTSTPQLPVVYLVVPTGSTVANQVRELIAGGPRR